MAASESEPAVQPTVAWEIGARALNAELAGEGPSAVEAIAQRLSPERGRRLLAAGAA